MQEISRTHLEVYRSRFEKYCELTRRDGIIELRMQSDGGPFRWGPEQMAMLPELFFALDHDEENEVIIWTGTGGSWITRDDDAMFKAGIRRDKVGEDQIYRVMYRAVHRILKSIVDVNIPIVAAINGALTVHAEALMSDIVICSDDASFRDIHFDHLGIPPGDGAQTIFRELLGRNRSHYFLLMGETITAVDARQLGLVGEVVPRDKLVGRAWEIASYLMTKSRMTRLMTRALLMQPWRELITREVAFGMAHECLPRAV